jgi:ethanolamine utilization protein EutN
MMNCPNIESAADSRELPFIIYNLEFKLRANDMLIGKVIGDIVATQKAPSHEGRKILVVQPLNLDGTDRGDAVLALDAVDAGVGDRVLLATEGFSAMTSVGRPNSPIDMAVIGVIDAVELVERLK